MLGRTDELGTIEVGKRADLVIVGGDPLADLRALQTIRWTVRNGVARTPQEWMAARVSQRFGPKPGRPSMLVAFRSRR